MVWRESDDLVYGWWAFLNEEAIDRGIRSVHTKESIAKYVEDVTIFVAGGKPFNQSHLPSIRGTINYATKGVVGAPYVEASMAGSGSWTADINLVVDFSNSSELGSIRGTMTGFNLNDYFRPSGSLILEESPIGDSHSGFFEGDVSGNLDDRIWDGKWGGQFYSHDDVPFYDQNENVDYVIPGTVAGTMAARSLDDDQHWILSMWHADLQLSSLRAALNAGP
ncbi:MAG: hypothetical protein OXF23_06610, partial [Candidatus Dadabacteria bacterium]|nr:hypothetical protein [Candidatus Dadabacteria bacterium]